MKIEIGESLACSWLRHVRQCWLVQANWKFLEHWERRLTDPELQVLFDTMRARFDVDGGVFKKTRGAGQFLRQGEIDSVGVDHGGGVHAVEIAFHEAGLKYGTTTETSDRVLKKMLRTLIVLRALRPPETQLHIYFLSPKVNPADQQLLEETFAALRKEYPDVEWQCFVNDDFGEEIVRSTLEKAHGVADSSELFARSAKLLELMDYRSRPHSGVQQRRRAGERKESAAAHNKIRPLVEGIVQTLLVDAPQLLSASDRRGLQDREYCRDRLNLRINYALLRKVAEGPRGDDGRNRYWTKTLSGRPHLGDFYICNNWKEKDHYHNARHLLTFVEGVAVRNAAQPEVKALRQHEEDLRAFLAIAASRSDS